MRHLNFDRLEAIDPQEFRSTKPYPWINPEGLISHDGYRALAETLPDIAKFERQYEKERAHGQRPHDRYNLEYEKGLDLSVPWREFIGELTDGRYHDIMCRLFGVRAVDLRLHWHYQPAGCSVSPHCDSKKKLGSHLFYFNTEEEWVPSWGGQTQILDDGGRFHRNSAPEFEDFECVAKARSFGNYSLLFAQGAGSWHGVEEIRCPEGQMRKVLIVVIQRVRPLESVWRGARRMLPSA